MQQRPHGPASRPSPASRVPNRLGAALPACTHTHPGSGRPQRCRGTRAAAASSARAGGARPPAAPLARAPPRGARPWPGRHPCPAGGVERREGVHSLGQAQAGRSVWAPLRSSSLPLPLVRLCPPPPCETHPLHVLPRVPLVLGPRADGLAHKARHRGEGLRQQGRCTERQRLVGGGAAAAAASCAGGSSCGRCCGVLERCPARSGGRARLSACKRARPLAARLLEAMLLVLALPANPPGCLEVRHSGLRGRAGCTVATLFGLGPELWRPAGSACRLWQ